MTSLVKAEKAAAKVKVFVNTVAVRQTKAQAPTGSGPRMSPVMVVRNRARSCQAWGVTLCGRGTAKRMMKKTETEMRNGSGFVPCQRLRILSRREKREPKRERGSGDEA